MKNQDARKRKSKAKIVAPLQTNKKRYLALSDFIIMKPDKLIEKANIIGVNFKAVLIPRLKFADPSISDFIYLLNNKKPKVVQKGSISKVKKDSYSQNNQLYWLQVKQVTKVNHRKDVHIYHFLNDQ